MNNMNAQHRSAIFNVAILVVFVLMACTYLLRPIMEPDFFWHLKTGEWIWQNYALPTYDPFAYTSTQSPLARQLFTLQGFWLMQLFFNACIALFDLWGVFVIRLLFLAGFFWLFCTAFQKARVNKCLSLGLLLVFLIFFLENYALERPQVATFIGVGLVLVFYRHLRDNPEAYSLGRIVVLSSGLMAIWANCHGGVIVGQGILCLVLLCAIGSFGLWTLNDFANYRDVRNHGLINPKDMPVKAANFLEENQIHGRIFNTMNWGGYLIWRLYPHSKLFIDSRYLHPELVAESKRIAALEKSRLGDPLWQDMLDRDQVNTALLPLYDRRGRSLRLTRSFLESRKWKVVFVDDISAVFVRKRPL